MIDVGEESLGLPLVLWKSWATLTKAGEPPPTPGEEEKQSIGFCWDPWNLWSLRGGQEDLEASLVQDQNEKEDSAEGMKMEQVGGKHRRNNRRVQFHWGAWQWARGLDHSRAETCVNYCPTSRAEMRLW